MTTPRTTTTLSSRTSHRPTTPVETMQLLMQQHCKPVAHRTEQNRKCRCYSDSRTTGSNASTASQAAATTTVSTKQATKVFGVSRGRAYPQMAFISWRSMGQAGPRRRLPSHMHSPPLTHARRQAPVSLWHPFQGLQLKETLEVFRCSGRSVFAVPAIGLAAAAVPTPTQALAWRRSKSERLFGMPSAGALALQRKIFLGGSLTKRRLRRNGTSFGGGC